MSQSVRGRSQLLNKQRSSTFHMLMSRLMAMKSFRSGHFVNSAAVDDRPNNWTATRRLSGEIAPPTCRQCFFTLIFQLTSTKLKGLDLSSALFSLTFWLLVMMLLGTRPSASPERPTKNKRRAVRKAEWAARLGTWRLKRHLNVT